MITHKNIKKYKNFKKESQNLIDEITEKVKKDSKTNVIKYPEYKEAYEYVDNLFPDANVKKVIVYEADKSYFKKANFIWASGLYIRTNRSILICKDRPLGPSKDDNLWKSVIASLTLDEILVHELLHYCSHYYGKVRNRIMEEEFAYGYSYNYLKNKGYTDDEIIQANFLPFLITIIDQNKIIKKYFINNNIVCKNEKDRQNKIEKNQEEIFNLVKKSAIEIGYDIITIYKSKNKENKIKINDNKYDYLDI